MHRHLRSLLVGLILFITALIACRPGQLNLENYLKQGDKVLVAINDLPILTNRQLFEYLWSTDKWANGGTVDTFELSRIVDSIMMDTVAGLVADSDIVLTDYFVQNWGYEMRYDEVLLNAYYSKYIYSQIDIDTVMVRDFLDKNSEKYAIPGQVFFHHILVSPKYYSFGPDAVKYKYMSEEELATIQKDLAWELYEAIANGEPFEAIATEYSHDKMTKREGGLVGWSVRERYHDPFDSIAFSAELNVVQPPYQDEDGWHIIKVGDRVADGPVSLDRPEFFASVYAALRDELTTEISEKIMDSLKQDLTIEYNEEVLDRNVFTSAEDIVAAVVNGVDTIHFIHLRNYELDYRRAFGVKNSTPDIKKDIIGRIANRSLVIQAAVRDKLDTTTVIRRLKYDLRHETAKSLVLGSRYEPNFRPSDSAIAAYYETHSQDFVIEKPLKIQTILLSDSVLADFISDQAGSGIDFENLVSDYLDDGPKQDLSIKPIGPDDVSRDRWLLLHQIPIGSVTQPLRQDSLFAVIKLVERKMSLKLEHAHGRIITILTRQYLRDAINRFTWDNAGRFGVSRKETLTPIHMRPFRYRQNMVL